MTQATLRTEPHDPQVDGRIIDFIVLPRAGELVRTPESHTVWIVQTVEHSVEPPTVSLRLFKIGEEPQ